MSAPATPSSPPRTSRAAVILRIPVTLALVATLVVVGILWQGLWRPFEATPTFDVVAYGLPAFLDGRWWTPLTGTFFVNNPWVYAFTLTSFAGMGFLEFHRGSRVASAYFAIGQLFAIFGSALFLSLASLLPWQWAITEAGVLDVGPSGGSMACIAAAIGLFISPWRIRAWLILLAFIFVALMFWGALADLEHALAVLLVLFVDRSLRVQRATVREQRFVAFVALLMLGAVDVITLVAPTDGPFGHSDPASGSVLDVLIDVVVIAVIATGLRRGRRWAWVVSIVLAVFNVLAGVLVAALLLSGVLTTAILAVDPSPGFAQSAIWLLVLVYLVWVRRAFGARRKSTIGAPPIPTVDDARTMLHAHGGGTLSWMTTWDNLHYARTSTGLVAYQRRAGVALALADPLGPQEGRAQSVREFVAYAEHAGLVPCFFSASAETRDATPSTWRSLVVADDTIVDLPGLAFTGKAWGAVRTAINRADREDVTFRLTRLADEPWGIQQQVRAISEMWVGDKGLPEMAFTLGSLDEAADPEVRLALAVSSRGDVDGFLSWLPVYGPSDGAQDGDGERTIAGWTLDLMRRRDGGFGPVMEFLIGSSARAFSDEGALVMSLSGAPLTHDYPPGAGAIADLSDKLAEMLEPVYGFRSLHRFKSKFQPRYETMYLLYRDEADLGRVGAALLRAFLPDASVAQFAGAGMELVRGDRS